MTTTERGIAELAWRQQSVWSQAANAAKNSIVRARVNVLVLTVAAALAGTAAAQTGGAWSRGLATVAAVALALTPIAAAGTSPRRIQDWTRLRSVSEALKAEVYEYLAGVAPYRGVDRDDVLNRRTAAPIDDAGDLAARPAVFYPVERPLPAVADVRGYIGERVEKQIHDYYRPKARQMAARSAVYVRSATAATLVAAVGSAVAGVTGQDLTVWVAVVTTFGASLLAFSTAQRYSYQQLEFTRTAFQLERLVALAPRNGEPTREDSFVAQCEQVISVSNEAWMAKVAEPDETA